MAKQIKGFIGTVLGPRAPRQYAANIYKLNTKEERRAHLEKVPHEFKSLVEYYVIDWFRYGKKRAENAKKAKLDQILPTIRRKLT